MIIVFIIVTQPNGNSDTPQRMLCCLKTEAAYNAVSSMTISIS